MIETQWWRLGVQHAMNVIVLEGPPGHEEFRERLLARLKRHYEQGPADVLEVDLAKAAKSD